MLVFVLIGALALVPAAGAKKSKTAKTATFTNAKAVPIPTATPAGGGAPFTTGKAESDITVPKKKNVPIKSLEVSAIVAPSSASAQTIGIGLRLVGPSHAIATLATPFGGIAGFPGIPSPPKGVGYGTGTSCKSGAMTWSNNSEKTFLSSQPPDPATNDPSQAEFTSFPPYAEKVFTNLNAVYKGLNSKGTWRLIALNGSTTAADTASIVCWSMTVKPQKLAKGESA
jgi:hypothetical protein